MLAFQHSVHVPGKFGPFACLTFGKMKQTENLHRGVDAYERTVSFLQLATGHNIWPRQLKVQTLSYVICNYI